MTFTKENQKERFRFIDQWAEYVRTHSDQDWSATAERHHQLLSAYRFDDKGTVPCDEKHRRRDETGKKRKETHSKRSSEVSQKSLTGTVIYTVRARRPDRFSVTVHPD